MVWPINRFLVQRYGIFLIIAPAKGKRPDKGKGRLRVIAPDRKGPKGQRAKRAITLAQFDVYPVVSGTVLTQAGDGRLVQVNGDTELVQLWRIGKSVSGADCRMQKADPDSIRICFFIFNKLCRLWLRPPYASEHKYRVQRTPRGSRPDNLTTTASSPYALPDAPLYVHTPHARRCAPCGSSGAR